MSRFAPYRPQQKSRGLTGVVYRHAHPDDAEAIADIDVERNRDSLERIVPLIRAELRAIADGDPNRATFVAQLEDEILAYGRCGGPDRMDRWERHDLPRGWYLTGVTVASAHRRRGIARDLTLHRLQWLRERTDSVYYFAAAVNRASIRLHEGLGFREIRRGITAPGVDFTGGTGLLFECQLG